MSSDLATMSVDELRRELVRVAQMQENAATQQATAAKQTLAPTQALASFTRALSRATWALFIVGGATVLLTIVQIVFAVKGAGR